MKAYPPGTLIGGSQSNLDRSSGTCSTVRSSSLRCAGTWDVTHFNLGTCRLAVFSRVQESFAASSRLASPRFKLAESHRSYLHCSPWYRRTQRRKWLSRRSALPTSRQGRASLLRSSGKQLQRSDSSTSRIMGKHDGNPTMFPYVEGLNACGWRHT
jgi:hypothetical protein